MDFANDEKKYTKKTFISFFLKGILVASTTKSRSLLSTTSVFKILLSISFKKLVPEPNSTFFNDKDS